MRMADNPIPTATSVLREEHRLILKVAGALDLMLSAHHHGQSLDYDRVAKCIMFFRLFADACHHGKEEDLLFPELVAKGMSKDAGPIAVMLDEHEQGRAFVGIMRATFDKAREGNEQAGAELVFAAEGFIELIVAHIGKEDNVLFGMSDGMIVGNDCRDLCAGYDEVCGRSFEGQSKEDLERLAGEIV